MKKYVNAIIVVEGRTDVSFISNFIDSEFVITNGSCVPRETLDYLIAASKTKEIIVLTDPDSPGKRIRDLINSEIPNISHAFVSKEFSIKNGKVGVAESTKEEILRALDKKITANSNITSTISMFDLVNLRLVGYENSNELREFVSKKLSLGHSNAKTFLKRLNYVSIPYNRLREICDEYE